MVRNVKRTFYAVLGNRRLTDEGLKTTLCLGESTLNNRPLSTESADPTGFDAITPSHPFLLENRSSSVPSRLAEVDLEHCRRNVRAQCSADSIWKR